MTHPFLDQIVKGDCLEVMPELPDKSVDLILCDLPYGTTACKWDIIIPFEPLWKQYERIIKPTGAIVLTAGQPFTTLLIASNMKLFRYTWVWDKGRGTNFQLAKKQPMKCHEDVCVFYKKQPTYSPQWWYDKPYKVGGHKRTKTIEGLGAESTAANICPATVSADGRRYPLSIIRFTRDKEKLHPTQKPVSLFEYLIRTYSNEGEVVLDNCIGSGTTAVAAMRSKRHFIGIEFEQEYVDLSNKRIAEEANVSKKDGE